MVHLRLPDGPATWPEAKLVSEVTSKRLSMTTEVSLDGGATWVTALAAVQVLKQRGDDALAVLLPVHVEPLSLIAGYVAILTAFFFGGPLVFVATLMAWDTGPKLVVRLGAVAVGLLLGPLPPALAGAFALRALKRDSSLRGKGRAVFALVVAALLCVPLIVGLGFIALR